jgi:Flp pilus assembly protein TadD
MNLPIRLLAVCLLVCLVLPQYCLAGGDKGKVPFEIGERYFAREDYRTALQYYRKALGQNDVRAHYRMGLIYEDAGKDRDALRHYKRYIDLGSPGSMKEDAVRRAAAIERRLAQETSFSIQLLERGKALFTEGKYRDAEKVLLQAAAEDGTNPEIHFYLGEVYMELEEYSKAESEFMKAEEYY